MHITLAAQNAIKTNALYLVILVEIGGCKNFLYNMYFSNEVCDFFVMEDLILTDEYSMPFLFNSKIDYVYDIGYQDFVITDNDFLHCHCGRSFE